MEWPGGKEEPACSKNRKKVIVVGAWQIGTKGMWIEVEEVRVHIIQDLLKV